MKICGKCPHHGKNADNLVACPPKVTKLKTLNLPIDKYTNAENFVKTVQRSRHWGANLWPRFKILTVLGAVFPHFCPDKREIWHGGALPVPNFTFIGATCRPCGAKNPFWTTE